MPLVSRHGPLWVKIDHDGKVLDDPLGLGYNEAGFVIHTHTRTGVAISAMRCGQLTISQHAMRVEREVSYHDYEGIALDM